MDSRKVLMGTLPPQVADAQNITFSVTEDCDLRCKYCYMFHKNNFNRMTFEVAKKAVDFLLSQEPKMPNVVWDFIGGEPTLEMDLIDKITDYIKIKLYETNHIWFSNSIFHIGTNGMSYRTKAVQDYIKKNDGIVQFSLTIDGVKEKHDMQRVKKDGSGSFDEVLKSVMLWQEQFPKSTTKVTFASADLLLLKESICYLWSLGLKIIPANIVFEDVWKDGDVTIFEQQLTELANYIIDNEMYYDYSVRFFDPNVGFQMSKADKENNFCGSGKMICIDSRGILYPCVRFMDFCMESSNGVNSGDIYNGFNKEVIDNFSSLTINNISDEECINCAISSGCFSCAANNYSCLGTIHKRTKYHCEMQKANVRVNKYFWRKYSEKTGEVSELQKNRLNVFRLSGWQMDGLKFLYILAEDNILPQGDYIPYGNNKMSKEIFQKAMNYTYDNNVVPVIVGKTDYMTTLMNNEVNIKFVDGSEPFELTSEVEYGIGVFKCNAEIVSPQQVNVLHVSKEDIDKFVPFALKLLTSSSRLNILRYNFSSWNKNDIEKFENHIVRLKDYSVNILSAGKFSKDSYALAPNGMVYRSPADCYNNNESYISTLDEFDIYKSNVID